MRNKFGKVSNRNLQKGQALLVIVLIMVVILTIGLSLATRSIINTRSSTEENNSQEAFTAAEAGIERLLQDNSLSSIPDGRFGNVTYNAEVVTGNLSEFLLNGGNQVLRGEGVDLWLSTYPSYTNQWSGTFTVYWGSSDDCSVAIQNVAAVEVVVLSGLSKNNPSAQHYVFDPCPVRQNANKFNGTVGPGRRIDDTRTFVYSGSVSVTNGFIARIIPLYANTYMGVTGSNLPPQGKTVESTGNAGGTARKISVFQSYPRLPIEIFPYVIFSP